MPFSVVLLETHSFETCMNQKQMQESLMELFFANIVPYGRAALSEQADIQEDYLQWKGVTSAGVLYSVSYDKLDYGNFNLSVLPHSTQRISINRCHQKYSIETLMLPRCLRTLSVVHNEIHGSINLQNLPLDFKELLAFNNKIGGRISLVNLPSNMSTLNLSNNRITQKVVWYDILPESIHSISLDRGKKAIRKISPLDPEKELSEKRWRNVFCGDFSKNYY